MSELPTGTVTFLFTDIEGSTGLLHELGAKSYAVALGEHRRTLREAFARHGGVEVDTEGDASFVAFSDAAEAMAAAKEAQEALASGTIRVRMGLHTGTPHVTAQGYVGVDVHKGARIAASSHGGQVVLSKETRTLLDERFELLDLGEHRVKDFGAPVWIYQLGTDRFPPLKTISNTNLPRPPSSFVGRRKEVADIAALLRDDSRLVTLVGPGGTGKTRLAIETATELVPNFKSGVFWIDLAPLTDPTSVVFEIAQAIGAKGTLAEHIGERDMLLVVDNFEQVVQAAPEITALLSACPNLRVLVTSRERLRVRGERLYEVAPLPLRDATDLFEARSGLAPDSAIDELCRRLDNLPLAVELAAARTSVLSPEQILARLSTRLDLLKGGRDVDTRQQTLRATISWSYDLLSDEERSLLARLAVFVGGWTLEAADAVAGADIDVLQSLTEKSLVRRAEDRFAMLETIREFAVERLDERGDREAVRDLHLRYLVDLAEHAWAERNTDDSKWLDRIVTEHDNIRAALEWAPLRDPQAEAQLAGAVASYLMGAGFMPEVRSALDGALARYTVRDGIRARALTHRAELDDSLPMLEQALEIWREIGDARGEALALEAIGWVHDTVGDYQAAEAAYLESLAVLEQHGLPEVEGGMARAGLCHALVAVNNVAAAEAMANELLDVATRSRNSLMRQLALHFLADCSLLSGDYAEAERRYLGALAYAREIHRVGRAIDEVVGVAMSRSGQGDVVGAVRLAAAAKVEREALGRSDDAWWKSMQERFIDGARTRLSADEIASADEQGKATRFEPVVEGLLSRSPT